MSDKERGSHWNEQLQSWEYSYEGSLEQAIDRYMADPTEENKQAYMDKMESENKELIEAITRWHSEGGASS